MKESFLIEDRYLRSPNDVLRIALAWHENGKEIALATVIGTWGSSPRPKRQEHHREQCLR